MRLAPRLVLAFWFIAALSVAGLGAVVREDRRATETRRFAQEVHSACERVVAEIGRQAESDRKLVGGACQSGELVDRALIWLEAGTFDDERRLALSRLVPEERNAFDLDELVLATADGDRLGQDPMTLIHLPRSDVAALVGGDVAHFGLRASGGGPPTRGAAGGGSEPALVSRCRKQGPGALAVGLVGARHLAPVIERLGKTVDATVTLGPALADAPPVPDDVAQASCTLIDAAGTQVPIVVSKTKAELAGNLARIDQTILYAGLMSAGIALLLAVLLARSLGAPIAELAAEARKVASGEARPLPVRGAGEIAELAQAFDTMLVDLETTRRRLAATSRVAAWREVARRVAHEIKNPLAPIRAAVETLRRLRARQDPEFDAYFDQATRTVLDEVMRISNIVTEFTRFARLRQPRPEIIDLVEVARQVVQMHSGEASGGGVGAGKVRLTLTVEGKPPLVRADREQITGVLTNLVQNALEAVGAERPDPVGAERRDAGDAPVAIDAPEKRVGAGGGAGASTSNGEDGEVLLTVGALGASQVFVTVSDNGPGLRPDIASRLFEPYATSKSHGTGLGLAIAQRIAIEHNGELSYLTSQGATSQGGSSRGSGTSRGAGSSAGGGAGAGAGPGAGARASAGGQERAGAAF
ncbi:MAG TPA: ATP-binding protein, partial [Polyangiaceae bacterium]|nr:ATP-binding protein [Polyangiaceae bacterium]